MSIMDGLFSKANLRCVICDAPIGQCDCWTKCECGWSFEKGGKCRNPVHGGPEQPLGVTHMHKGPKP